MPTTRSDRRVLVLAYIVSALIVLTISVVAFGTLGPIELLLGLVLAIPLAFVVNRRLQPVFARRTHRTYTA